MKKIYSTWFLSVILLSFACQQKKEPLPILSKKIIIDKELAYETIPDFTFLNQDSNWISNADFTNKIYIADFFFTSCPTICPKMTQEMLRIYDRFEQTEELLLLSHTIDPKRDSVSKLSHYAKNLGVTSDKWHFVTGEKDELYQIADYYYNKVIEDQNLPDGFDHSSRFILVDQNRLIRAYCNGTSKEEVDEFINKIERLLHENK